MDDLNRVTQALVAHFSQPAQSHPEAVQQLAQTILSSPALKGWQRQQITEDPGTSATTITKFLEQMLQTDENIRSLVERVLGANSSSSSGSRNFEKAHFGDHTMAIGVNHGPIQIGAAPAPSPATANAAAPAPAQPFRANIFISYRRSASQGFVNALAQQLRLRVVGEIFVDTHSIDPGPFPQRLREAIHRSDIFLSVFSRGTLERLHDPNDWVRAEIVEALRLNKLIIPLCEGNTPFPRTDELPAELQPLLNYTGKTIPYELFEDGVKNLVDFMKRAH